MKKNPPSKVEQLLTANYARYRIEVKRNGVVTEQFYRKTPKGCLSCAKKQVASFSALWANNNDSRAEFAGTNDRPFESAMQGYPRYEAICTLTAAELEKTP